MTHGHKLRGEECWRVEGGAGWRGIKGEKIETTVIA